MAAIEALWDGDTVRDWFVVPEGPDGEGHLATVHHRPDDATPPRPAAAEAGRALADHLGVPFHFASPNVPGDQAPRWRAVARPAEGSNRSFKRT
ncbi:hypothetical protein AB0L10_15230 [Streptomyces flaveolus]|uniref:hypothetical protein n=1 Tax=Streptomyces flaveolus TaxID=67297 RepID=UPI003412D451